MKEVKINHIYKHYKGDYYLILDIAYHSETLEPMIIYRSLYGDMKLWARPYHTFFEEVNQNGQTYRFEEQQINSKRI